MEQARAALSYCLKGLRPADRFNVVDFSTSVRSFSEFLVQAAPDSIEQALEYVSRMEASGGTNIADALDKAYASSRQARSGRDACS